MDDVDARTLRGELEADDLERRAREALRADGVEDPDDDEVCDEMRRIAEDDAEEADPWGSRGLWPWGWRR